jgi:hypothetical protein
MFVVGDDDFSRRMLAKKRFSERRFGRHHFMRQALILG